MQLKNFLLQWKTEFEWNSYSSCHIYWLDKGTIKIFNISILKVPGYISFFFFEYVMFFNTSYVVHPCLSRWLNFNWLKCLAWYYHDRNIEYIAKILVYWKLTQCMNTCVWTNLNKIHVVLHNLYSLLWEWNRLFFHVRVFLMVHVTSILWYCQRLVGLVFFLILWLKACFGFW